jgi:hypothetical protein
MLSEHKMNASVLHNFLQDNLNHVYIADRPGI